MSTPFETYIRKVEDDLRGGKAMAPHHYAYSQRVVVALKETIRLMNEIDKTIPAWPLG